MFFTSLHQRHHQQFAGFENPLYLVHEFFLALADEDERDLWLIAF